MQSLDVFNAISDERRREIIALLSDDKTLNITQISSNFDSSRQAVSKHLSVLEGARLLKKTYRGRETLYKFNPKPLKKVADWVSEYEMFWDDKLDSLKKYIERR